MTLLLIIHSDAKHVSDYLTIKIHLKVLPSLYPKTSILCYSLYFNL